MSILGLVPQNEVSQASEVRLCSKGKPVKGWRQEAKDGYRRINVHSRIFGNISKLGITLMSSISRISEKKKVIFTQLDAT